MLCILVKIQFIRKKPNELFIYFTWWHLQQKKKVFLGITVYSLGHCNILIEF